MAKRFTSSPSVGRRSLSGFKVVTRTGNLPCSSVYSLRPLSRPCAAWVDRCDGVGEGTPARDVVNPTFARILRFVEENGTPQVLAAGSVQSGATTGMCALSDTWHHSYDEEDDEGDKEPTSPGAFTGVRSAARGSSGSDAALLQRALAVPLPGLGAPVLDWVSMEPRGLVPNTTVASASACSQAWLLSYDEEVATGSSVASAAHVLASSSHPAHAAALPQRRSAARRGTQPRPTLGDLEGMQPWTVRPGGRVRAAPSQPRWCSMMDDDIAAVGACCSFDEAALISS